MGATCEFNYYVVCEENDIEYLNRPNILRIIKTNNRMYPIQQPLPLIIKTKGCIGMCKIINIEFNINRTYIYFEMLESWDRFYPIAQHYYKMYEDMRNNKYTPVSNYLKGFTKNSKYKMKYDMPKKLYLEH